MTVVALSEHQRLDRVPLSAEAGWALARSNLVSASPSRPAGTWQITAKDRVGAARIGPVELRITPKLPLDRLFFLLGYQQHWDDWLPGPVETRPVDGLVEAIARAFARQADHALRQGPLRGYLRMDDALPTVRGRIRESVQMRRRFGFPVPVEVSYHEFTLDTAENRLLLAAARRLLRLPGIPDGLRPALRRIPARLVGVSALAPGRPLPAWPRNRLNERYHAALGLSELILRDASPQPADGAIQIDGFMLDMDQVFESFVIQALSDALAVYRGHSRLQDTRHHLDADRVIQLRPDLVWDDAVGRPAAVADAKYKLGERGRYPREDIYQMLAYCTRLGLRHGHLVYAAGPAPRTARRIVNAQVEIFCHALDLTAAPSEILKQIASIAAVMVAEPA